MAAMQSPVMALVSVCFVYLTACSQPPPDRFYNVLMLSPISAKSHVNILMHMAEGLAKRGHKITLLSSFSVDAHAPNITVLTHSLPYFIVERLNVFDKTNAIIDLVTFLPVNLWKFARDFYKDPTVKKLYSNRTMFDAVIIDIALNEVSYPFAYQKPFIALCVTGSGSSSFGHTPNPAYVSSSVKYFETPMTFLQRMENYFLTMGTAIARYLMAVTPVQHQISKQFPGLPSLLELESNQSVSFINSHSSLNSPEPLLPGQVEIGCIQCKPAKTLPKNLLDFVAGDVPVVYFGLGTAFTLPEKHKQTVISAFKKLPYKFIFKNHEEMNNVSSNILSRSDLPQQDILGHPNVKLFITHGGSLGMQEAVYHNTPMLAIPGFADQPKMSKYMQSKGLGITLYWKDLTVDLLMDTIVEIITNQKYQRRVSEVSALLHDQPSTAEERAVYWTEFVIRQRGARHLRSAERDLTWIQIFHIDIMIAFAVAIYLMYKAMRISLRMGWTVSLLFVRYFRKLMANKLKNKTH